MGEIGPAQRVEMKEEKVEGMVGQKPEKKTRRKKKQHQRTSTPQPSGKLPKLLPIDGKYKVYEADGTAVHPKHKFKPIRHTHDASPGKDHLPKLPQKGTEADNSLTLSESSKSSWVTYGSPLWKKDSVQYAVKPLPSLETKSRMEKGFVNDAIRTFMYHYPRRKPIIPVYNAERDKCAQAYFQSPIAKSVLERSLKRILIVKAEEDNWRVNKLSYRGRIKQSPSVDQIRARERNFTNDAIITEKLRTKYKDIIPKYDATSDNHCRRYFNRPDVQKLVSVTCGGRR